METRVAACSVWMTLTQRAAALLFALALSARACTTDLDCSLNGLCVSGSCACDAAWLGADCSTLALLPSARGDGDCDPSLNGTAVGYTTTWGGHPVVGDDGVWHAHVAEMALHCGMCAWGSQSQVAHYVAASVTGPYARRDLAVGAFAHNPVVVRTPAGTPNNASFIMFHIGIGCDSAGAHACNYTGMPECANGSTPIHPGRPTSRIPPPPNVTRATTHVAASLDGPWLETPASWRLPSCSNPAPVFLRNGSLALFCHGSYQQCGPLSGGLSFFMSASANWTAGPYNFQCLNVTNPTYTFNGTVFHPANEDPHAYVDERGALHVLTHNQSPCYSGPVAAAFYGADVRGCGGHFYSADGGASWTFAWRAAYNGTVLFSDGARMTYKRERPKVVQDARGRIVALATGVGPSLVDAFAAPNDTACTLVAAVRGA